MAGTTTTATLPSGSASAGKRSQRNVKTLPLIAPSVIVLFLWMIVPLAMSGGTDAARLTNEQIADHALALLAHGVGVPKAD